MNISERKRKILKAVVDDYIERGQPVSSKDICSTYLPDVSPATVRNELSALESMGFLSQPHVSSGRIPTQRAFRLYVDDLMELKPLSDTDIQIIDSYFDHKLTSVEEITRSVAQVISELTNYTSVVVKENGADMKIEKIKVLELLGDNALVVIVTSGEVLKDNIITLPKGIDEDGIETANKWLNKMFVGKYMSEFTDVSEPMEQITAEFSGFRDLYAQIVDVIRKIKQHGDKDVYTTGRSKILDYPEYTDVDRAKDFLTKLDRKEDLADMLTDTNDLEFTVKIGQEDDNLPVGCSLVSAKISINDTTLANAGVIGPVRMDYTKVIGVLEHIGTILDNIKADALLIEGDTPKKLKKKKGH
ncbi:MAG: heat-inducible transcriptional repressor HrcA [Clostridia bacterium]|nr:heat-inducible transcriptional repressor HrcA [Clostridia bacterium]